MPARPTRLATAAAAVLAAAVLLAPGLASPAAAQETGTPSFFLTSQGPGNGADLGGLEGADAHCAGLAAAAGLELETWHAYLSTLGGQDGPAMHARDRIGTGPWYNVAGVMVARDVDHLHAGNNDLTKETVLDETGAVVNGRGDDPNRHDILTGSDLDGTAYRGGEGYDNCDDFTSSASDGSTRVGHHDRTGGGEHPTSWNSAHDSRGCGQSDLQGTGGDGLFYCFAVREEEG